MLGKSLPYDSVKGVRARLAEVAPHFGVINNTQGAVWLNGEYMKSITAGAVQGSTPLTSPISNFFMTDAISRASQTMAKCVQARQKAQK